MCVQVKVVLFLFAVSDTFLSLDVDVLEDLVKSVNFLFFSFLMFIIRIQNCFY